MNKIVVIVALLVVLVVGGMAVLQSKRADGLSQSFQSELQARMEADAAIAEKDERIVALSRRIERLEADTEELPALRGEVARLRQENEKLKTDLATAAREAEAVRSQLESTRNTVPEPGFLPRTRLRQQIDLAQAPLPVQQRIASQYPGVTIRELVYINDEGQTIYTLHGVSTDETGVHAVINADGTILGQEIEMGFDQIPDPIRGAVVRELGADTSMNMIQVWEEGTTTYRGSAERDGQQFSYVFSESGELIWHEAAE